MATTWNSTTSNNFLRQGSAGVREPGSALSSPVFFVPEKFRRLQAAESQQRMHTELSRVGCIQNSCCWNPAGRLEYSPREAAELTNSKGPSGRKRRGSRPVSEKPPQAPGLSQLPIPSHSPNEHISEQYLKTGRSPNYFCTANGFFFSPVLLDAT